LKESLQIESESSSPAKSGKGGGANLADKKKYNRQQIQQYNNSPSVQYAETSTMSQSVQRKLTG
jgi:hypothetical protein